MKKILLICFLAYSQLSIAQLGSNAPIYDATDFESGLKYIYTTKQGDVNGCQTYINAEVTFASPIPENHPGPSTAFGYYQYELVFYIYGIDANGNETLVKTKTRYRNDYDGYPALSNYGYRYSLNKDAEYPFYVGDLPYEFYFAKIRITKIITNNDPGLLILYPSTHWEQKDIYPQPICGGNACPTEFMGKVTVPGCIGADSNDDDEDNIPNSSDNCPNNYNPNQEDTDGDGIGDACDSSDNNAKPNLTLSKLSIKVASTTYDIFGNTNNIPVFKYGENHTFNITIKNDDDGYASSSKYKLLVSEENKYPIIGTKPVYEYRTINASSIEGNSARETFFSEYFYDNISGLNLVDGKTYYMFIDIDPNNDVDESNENINDNVKFAQFKYSKPTTGKIALKIDSNGSTLDIDYEFTSDTNYLRLQNIWYTQLNYLRTLHGLTPTVDVSHLYDGVYALYINNTFVKKIGLTTGRTYTGGPSPHEP